MSKQSDAKEKQGYTSDVKKCATCKNFKFDLRVSLWMEDQNQQSPGKWPVKEYGIQKNKRCQIGGFAVKSTAVCNSWEPVDEGKKSA